MTSPFVVHQDAFHGPLDLLLHLVREREVDVLEVSLADVAQAYVEHVEALAAIDLEEIGEFLVIAAWLMEIKSRALLPRESEVEEEEEDQTRSELVRQLLEYRRFKEASDLLRERGERQRDKLARLADDLPRDLSDPARAPLRELELWDLVSAFSRLMKENIVPEAEGIVRDPTPIETYMDRLDERVRERGSIRFADLLGRDNTRAQLIGKFLALLELIRLNRVWVEWIEATDDIVVHAAAPERSLFDASGATPTVEPAIHESAETTPPPTMPADDDPPAHDPFDPGTSDESPSAVDLGMLDHEPAPLPAVDPVATSNAWADYEPIELESEPALDAAGADDAPDRAPHDSDDPPPDVNSARHS